MTSFTIYNGETNILTLSLVYIFDAIHIVALDMRILIKQAVMLAILKLFRNSLKSCAWEE